MDTHLHLEDVQPWAEAVEEAVAAGVGALFAMGVDAASSRRAVAMAEAHPAVWAAAGHHPMNAAGPDLAALRELCAHPRVVAVGEVGLDRSEDEHVGPFEAQLEWFDAMCGLAAESGLPVCVHVRDCAEEVHRELAARPGLDGVIHYWALDRDWARRFLDLGFHISFAGTVTRRSREHLRDVARYVPADRLLLETDAPWGTPQGRKGSMRPAWILDTARIVAVVRGLSLEELAALERANAARLFPRFGASA